MFPPGTDHSAAIAASIVKRSPDEFGKLKLEVVIIASEEAQDGIDMHTDPSAVDPRPFGCPNR